MTKTMATSPTTQSATTSGAAKDDVVGLDNVFTFTVNQLLGNDPGGAAKVSVETQFFFGDTAADKADQQAYLDLHGIEKISDLDGGTYQIKANATDFNYKGTWSEAHVTVADTPDPVAPH